jgi:NAD-specific glutamate dehydrogenase
VPSLNDALQAFKPLNKYDDIAVQELEIVVRRSVKSILMSVIEKNNSLVPVLLEARQERVANYMKSLSDISKNQNNISLLFITCSHLEGLA